MARERFKEVEEKKKGDAIQLVVDLGEDFPVYMDVIELGGNPGGYGMLNLRLEVDKGKELEALERFKQWASREFSQHIDPEDYVEETPKKPDVIG